MQSVNLYPAVVVLDKIALTTKTLLYRGSEDLQQGSGLTSRALVSKEHLPEEIILHINSVSASDPRYVTLCAGGKVGGRQCRREHASFNF